MINQFSTNNAIDAVTAHPTKTTEKYRFINTRTVVDALSNHGWNVIKYNEARTKKYAGYQTHIVQLASEKMAAVGDSQLRILIVNDHKGGKSLQLKLGLFRLVCMNGMVVQDATIESVSIRHIGGSIDNQVSEFIERITIAAERLRGLISSKMARILSVGDQRLLALKCLRERFKGEWVTDDMITSVLTARRAEDMGNDTWSVFNRIQENIIRGGWTRQTTTADGVTRTATVRRITSVQRDHTLNAKLFEVMMAA